MGGGEKGEVCVSERGGEVGCDRGEGGSSVLVGCGAGEVVVGEASEQWGEARGEDEGTGSVPEVGAEGFAGGYEGALEGQGFAEGADENVGLNTVGCRKTRAARTEDAQGVGLIEDQEGVGSGAEVAEGGEVGCVGVHAEVGLGDDEAAAGGGGFEGLGGRLEAEVGDDADCRAAEAAAVDDGGVVETVGDDEIAWAGKRGKDADVGCVAAREEEGSGEVHPVGKGLLEVVLGGVGSVEEAGGSSATRGGGAGEQRFT